MSDDSFRGAKRTELGGIPAYVADTPGPVRAALIFRVGQADETLPRRGLTHLIEHLALGHFGRADAVGGAVDVLFTFALVEGSPTEVVERLHEIARRFSDPPTDRIATERRILYAEDGDKSPHPASELMALFYGPRGPGLTAFKEFGLRHAGPPDLCAHAEQWFSRENAALAMTAPLHGLEDLPLRSGGVAHTPDTTPLVPLSPIPAETAFGNARMALGAPLRGGDVSYLLAALLERKAWSALRQERGLAYDVECRAKPVGPDERLLYLTSDAAVKDIEPAVAVAVEEIGRLAAGDFSDEDLAAAKADVRRRAAGAPITVLMGAATAELAGGRIRGPSEILADHDAITRDEIAALATDLSRHLIATLPEGKRSGALPPLDTTTEPVNGTRYERVGLPRDPEAGDLIVGGDGVSAVSASGHVTTIRFADCVAAIREPDGVLALVGERGQLVVVDSREIQHGLAALPRIEASLPSELFVAAEGSSPERDAAARAHRQQMERLRGRVQGLRSSGDEQGAKDAVAEAIRQHPDDPVVLQLERQVLGTGSASKPVRVTWHRSTGN